MVFCPEHPKGDQNPKFIPLNETTSIPALFIWDSPPPPGIGILWWELVTLFFTSYTNDIVFQLDLSCFYSLVKKIIKAFFFCRLTGNFLHCCTLWFGWRFLNLFPYSVLSFCILDWIVSTHIKENVNSLLEPLQTKIHQHLKTSSSHLSTLALVSCHQWCVHGRWLENFTRSRCVFLQLICSC